MEAARLLKAPRHASLIMVQRGKKLHTTRPTEPLIKQRQSESVVTVDLRHQVTQMLQLLRFDPGAHAHHQGTHDDSAILSISTLSGLRFSGDAGGEDGVSEVVGVEFLAHVRHDLVLELLGVLGGLVELAHLGGG